MFANLILASSNRLRIEAKRASVQNSANGLSFWVTKRQIIELGHWSFEHDLTRAQ